MSADTDTDAEGDDHTVDYDLDLELDEDKDDKHVAFNVNNEASGIFKKLFSWVPERFLQRDSVKAKSDKYRHSSLDKSGNAADSRIKLKCFFEENHTWLKAPQLDPGDTISYWDDLKVTMRPSKQHKGHIKSSTTPRFSAFEFEDQMLGTTLLASRFGKLKLNPPVWSNVSKDVSTNPLSMVECVLRKSLVDAMITENLVIICLEVFDRIAEGEDVSLLHEKISAVQSTLCMVSDSNSRVLEHVMHAWASSKKLLRDAVLKEVNVPAQSFYVTNNTLKGPNLFGPYPESFLTAVRQPGSKLALTRRFRRSLYSGAGSSSTASASPYAPSYGPSPAKKPRPSPPAAGASTRRPPAPKSLVARRRNFRKGGGKSGNG